MRTALLLLALEVFVLLSGSLVEADLPVHCVHSQVLGKWSFHRGPGQQSKVGLKCSQTEQVYDHASDRYGLGEPNFNPADKLVMHLKEPNIVEHVVNQGSCGSCYAVAVTDMIQTRIRIKTKNRSKPALSLQKVLSCSEYSQGCKGGFPFLVGKYAQDFGMAPNNAQEYIGQRDVKCHKKYPTKTRTVDYHYVGGYYGACNYKKMMHELHKKGPIVVGFNTEAGLWHYSNGVYKDQGKYWIVKNSWGPNWGENGFFRTKRGVDSCAMESMAVAADPVIGDEKYFEEKASQLGELVDESQFEPAQPKKKKHTDHNDLREGLDESDELDNASQQKVYVDKQGEVQTRFHQQDDEQARTATPPASMSDRLKAGESLNDIENAQAQAEAHHQEVDRFQDFQNEDDPPWQIN